MLKEIQHLQLMHILMQKEIEQLLMARLLTQKAYRQMQLETDHMLRDIKLVLKD